MGRIAYVNGRYVSHGAAEVHIEDRGFQFADGVYEVCALKGGRFYDEEPHLDRLERSLRELAIAMPMPRASLKIVMRTLAAKSHVRDGLLYIQVTRGRAPRDHLFPAKARPSLVMTLKGIDFSKVEARAAAGIAVRTMPDLRWARCDIKSIALLPNVLAKQAAKEAGAGEAWLVDETGLITEGTSSNAWIVTEAGEIVTRQLDHGILAGVTRRTLMRVARDLQMPVRERAFSVEEAKSAKEAFTTAATLFVMPVVAIDGAVIGDGKPGRIAMALRNGYSRYA